MRYFSWLFAVVVLVGSLYGQPKEKAKEGPPKPLYPFPLALDAGKTSKLTVRGLRLDNVTEVRLQEPKSSGKVLGKARTVAVPNQMNADVIGDRELDIEISLPKEVPGGIIALSLIGPGGEGPTMNVLVNDERERLAEKEPNDGFKQAQLLKAACIVEGSIKQNQDVDVYQWNALAEVSYRIEVQARRVGSPVEALLTLYDAGGRIVASGMTTESLRDPVVTFKPSQTGTYFIVVQDANDQGAAMFHYRLALRTP